MAKSPALHRPHRSSKRVIDAGSLLYLLFVLFQFREPCVQNLELIVT